MRKTITLLAIIITFFINNEKTYSQFKKVNKDTIDSKLISKIYAFGFNTFNESGKLHNLTTEDATIGLLESYKLESIHPFRKTTEKAFGSLIIINLQEILQDSLSNLIFRYRAKYEKTDNVEIRVLLNKNKKIEKFSFIPIWNKVFYDKLPEPTNVELATINEKTLDSVTYFALKSFKNCEKGDFLKLTETNSTLYFLNSLTNEKLEKACERTTEKHGSLINLKLHSVLYQEGRGYIYRFKANYSHSENELEIRIYTDFNQKFRGIYILDLWYDKYYKHNKTPDQLK